MAAKKATKKTASKTTPKPATAIILEPMDVQTIELETKALSTLIVNRWSEKAREEMRAKQQHLAREKRGAKDPKADFQAAKYLDADGNDVVLGQFFKNAIVSAARFAKNVKMTELRGALFVEDMEIPLKFSKCVMREDSVRVANGAADLRYRPEYHDWSVLLRISFMKSMLSTDQVVDLVRRAGFGVGICEWRPEKNGPHGRWTVR